MSEPIYGIPSPIDYGQTFGTLSAAPENWGMKACYADEIRAIGGDGTGEIIAVLDTGIDPSHSEFAGKIIDTRSFTGEPVYDNNGHGTHVAGTAAGINGTIGVATKARILAGKCLSNQGSGSSTWIQAAFRWAMDAGATVVSMSIGGGGFLQGMEPLFLEANSRGIVPVVAVGNERGAGGVERFRSSGVVVAAFDTSGKFASFSTPGGDSAVITLSAPGVSITSARPGGGYQQMSGTSMATPFVAGGVAAIQSARVKAGLPRLTTAGIKTLFARGSIDAGPAGPDRDFGSGLFDFTLFASSLIPAPVVR